MCLRECLCALLLALIFIFYYSSLFCIMSVFLLCFLFLFFFFNQKPAYQLRISDWSSAVCSSDLSIAPDFAPLTDELGERWEAARVAFKPFACGTMTQPYVDCAVRLRRQGVRPEDVKAIVCEVGEGTVHRLWEPLAVKQRPPTAYVAKFSSPYCVAAGLIHGDAGLAQFTEEAVRDPRALALAAKVGYVIDPDNEYPANYTGHIRAELTDGRVVEERQGQLRGGTREPMSRDDLLAKARANLAFADRPAGAAIGRAHV